MDYFNITHGAEKITIFPLNARQIKIVSDYLTVYGYRHVVNLDGSITLYIRSNAIEISGVRNAIYKLCGDSENIGFAFHPTRF